MHPKEFASEPDFSGRFVRKTGLAAHEYRKNFLQIDCETIATLTSVEADSVTPLMSKIYLRLVNAPLFYWEREGVLRFEQVRQEGKSLNAWAVLCALLGVASATANKALTWMHEVGVIGYFAGKNGVGIRIFLNRAASSIGTRKDKKILPFPPASTHETRTSQNEAAFKDSYAILEASYPDSKSSALKKSAEGNTISRSDSTMNRGTPSDHEIQVDLENRSRSTKTIEASMNEIIHRLQADLESSLENTTRQVAAREHERTREWLENRGLPKAARVAQRETYNVLRKYGLICDNSAALSQHGEVGRTKYRPASPHRLNDHEIRDLAGACLAILETKGLSIDSTLSEMSTDAGGFLLPDDIERVRNKANSLSTG